MLALAAKPVHNLLLFVAGSRATISVSMAQPPLEHDISWHAHEFEHQHKSSDWYWGLGVLAIVGAATAIFFNNVMLAVIIVVGALVLGITAMRHPEPSHFALTRRGILIEDRLYPYQTLDSFFIEHKHDNRAPRLLVKSLQPMMPLIVIPIEDVDPDDVEDYLLDYLDMDEHTEPVAHRLFERLGF